MLEMQHEYKYFIFTQVDLVLDTAVLTDIVIHKRVQTYWTYKLDILYPNILHPAPPPSCHMLTQSGQAPEFAL